MVSVFGWPDPNTWECCSSFFLTLATFPRVWTRPSKHGNHKVIVYSVGIVVLNFIKYYSSWLHISSQLFLLDDYVIIRKYNELNHRDHQQININSDKNITQ
jgi:hypothetical protein